MERQRAESRMIYAAIALIAFALGHASAWLFARLYVRGQRNQAARREKALRKACESYQRQLDEAWNDPMSFALRRDRQLVALVKSVRA